MCCHFVFYLNHKYAHSARYLLGEHPREPVPVRAADAQARERVAVLDAAGVAAAVAERNAGHKRGQHGQHAPEDDACRPDARAAHALVENREHAGERRRREKRVALANDGGIHCSETQECIRKYEMIIYSHAWSLIMY